MTRRFLVFVPLVLAAIAAPAYAGPLAVAVEKTAAPGEPLPLQVHAAGPGALTVRAWRIGDPWALLDASVPLERGGDLGWLAPTGASRDASRAALRRAAAPEPVLLGSRFEIEAGKRRTIDLSLERPGLYLLAVSQGRETAYVTALVSRLALVVKRDRSSLLAWVVDRTTGAVLPQVRVEALRSGASASLLTNADGLARLDAADHPWLREAEVVRATFGDHLALARPEPERSAATAARVYLHTHQPAYRPGETVEVRGIARTREGGRYRIDPDLGEVEVRLVGPDGKEHATTTSALSTQMGTFAASLTLADDAPTGDWRVVAKLGRDGRSFAAPLVVDAYRKPAFEVRVRARDRRLLAGGETAFDVSASYYDGGAVAGAKITWSLHYSRMDRELFAEDELVRLFFGTEREAYRPVELARGEGVLDGEGRLTVDAKAPAARPDGALSLRAVVFGPDRLAVAGSGRVGLSRSPVAVDLRTDRHVVGPEDVVQVEVRVEGADGRPASGRTGVLTAGLLGRTDGRPAETWLHRMPFETDAGGRATLEVPLAAAGRYVFRAVVPRAPGEPAGAPAQAAIHVWAAGERATPGDPSARIDAVADRDSYEVGDVARVLVVSDGGSRPVLVTLEKDDLLDVRVVRPDRESGLIQVPLEERHVPNAFLSLTAVHHGRVLERSRTLRIPPRTKLLDVNVTPDVGALEPGATSGMNLRVEDATGAGVPNAEVSVAVVDEALFSLHRDPTASIEAFFHPPVRNAVATTARLDWSAVGFASPPPPPKSQARPAPGARAPTSPAPTAAPAEEEPALAEEMDEVEAENEDAAWSGSDAGLVPSNFTPPEGGLRDAAKKDAKTDGPRAVSVREDFRTAVFWEPALESDAEGRIRLSGVRYGDSLTRWRITATAVDAATRVGRGTGSVRTRRLLSTRLTLPRFLTAGDRGEIPLLVRNLTKEALDVAWSLLVDVGADVPPVRAEGRLALAAGGTHVERRIVEAPGTGRAVFEARAEAKVGRDAERREIPVHPQGIRKVTGHAVSADGGRRETTFSVPRHAEPGTVTCRISLEPAYAQAMLAALPYLLDYPYGCTEQTMNRFVPVVYAAEVMAALGRTSVPGVPEGKLDELVDAGLKRLEALQHPDGGFGWWETDATSAVMTALVVQGLARVVGEGKNENPRARALLTSAMHLLRTLVADVKRFATLDDATRASVLHALAQGGLLGAEELPTAGDEIIRAGTPLTRALLLRAAVRLNRVDLIKGLRGLLDDEAIRDEAGGVHWSPRPPGEGRASPTRWQDDDVETTATVLRALLEADVRPALLAGGADWLLRQRAGGDRWRSTRDTGAAVGFLAALTARTGDLGAGRRVTLEVKDTVLFDGALTLDAHQDGTASVEIPGAWLAPDARFDVTLICPEGRATAAIALRYHETGPAIAAATAGFRVRRTWYLLEPALEGGRIVHRRLPVEETLPSGMLVECEVTVETESPREYVMVTSPHPAGFEPAREVGLEVEGRLAAAEARREGYDDRTMFFRAKLPVGTSVFRHVLRATHVGTFTALPAQAELMYFPDVRGNGDGMQWQITSDGPAGKGVR